MSKKIIHLTQMFLLCDDCGWQGEPTTLAPTLIGQCCPECSATLLTPRQFKKARRAHRGIALVNMILGPIFGTRKPPEDGVEFRLKNGVRE